MLDEGRESGSSWLVGGRERERRECEGEREEEKGGMSDSLQIEKVWIRSNEKAYNVCFYMYNRER